MSAELSKAWDDRVESILPRLPKRLRLTLVWLRVPAHWWFRIPAALLFILGGLLSVLPVLGLWMLPVGFALFAEDVPGLKAPLEKSAQWLVSAWQRIGGRT